MAIINPGDWMDISHFGAQFGIDVRAGSGILQHFAPSLTFLRGPRWPRRSFRRGRIASGSESKFDSETVARADCL